VNTIVLRDTLLALLFLYVVLGIALTKKEKKVKIMNFALTNFSAALIGSTVGCKSKNAVICLCRERIVKPLFRGSYCSLYCRFVV
jgi:hypothetical protein